eukprot:TRINITY_DN521_c0_g2_i1.p1 TRINITY_DN521_c0_g2~~TRINITY_DN521_c0_g2_i1.p1  ORF type:complete len:228 (+),score=68.09 TRINITY_DN521_c0_g2_i1:91-684(+)
MASRSIARVFAPRTTALLRPRAIAPVAQHAARTYVTTTKYTRDDVLEKLNAYHSEVLGANWGDYLYLVYNVPFWEAELEKLTTLVQPYLHEAEVGAKFNEVQELMDVLYKCEDVRDHLNELAELCTRASGFMGTGYAAEEKVDNMDDHAKLCGEAYDSLLKEHPAFKPKIEQTVGHGLAILRQKYKFKWGTMHRYFF